MQIASFHITSFQDLEYGWSTTEAVFINTERRGARLLA